MGRRDLALEGDHVVDHRPDADPLADMMVVVARHVRQHLLARFFLVPFHIGWHPAHHVDAGVPFRNLPRFHRALHEAGYVDATLEYPSYPAIWRALAAERVALE